ncbi:MAG TPA: hypothetical protein VNT52_14990 [Acidimicrobiales bacterium]|nr:hypothetical protein [Acidimicrobiales bacterium]
MHYQPLRAEADEMRMFGAKRIGLAVLVGIFVVVGTAVAVAMQLDGKTVEASTPTTTVGATASTLAGTVPPAPPAAEGKAPATTPTTVKARTAATTPAAKAAPVSSVPAKATPEEVQKVIAGIMAQLKAPPANAGTTTRLTDEQVEAMVREQLKQLGIYL